MVINFTLQLMGVVLKAPLVANVIFVLLVTMVIPRIINHVESVTAITIMTSLLLETVIAVLEYVQIALTTLMEIAVKCALRVTMAMQ